MNENLKICLNNCLLLVYFKFNILILNNTSFIEINCSCNTKISKYQVNKKI